MTLRIVLSLRVFPTPPLAALPLPRVRLALSLSEKLVENTIREIKPQVVMVELDAQRVGSFMEESMKVGFGISRSPSGRRCLFFIIFLEHVSGTRPACEIISCRGDYCCIPTNSA